MRFHRCSIAAAIAAALHFVPPIACSPVHGAEADRYPVRPIRLIVPFPPGGSNDILGRFIAQRLTERNGQQTVVDNRPGADGIIGTEIAAKATPDGYTLLVISTSYAMNPAVHKLPYDPVKAFAGVSMIGTGGNVLAVHPALPAATLKEFIALARAKPGHYQYASSGVGGFNHFGGELFKSLTGIDLVHVPYKGGGPALVDTIAGQVPSLFGTLTQTLPHLRSGKLRALGVGGQKRSPLLPEVPTIAESGVPGYDGSIWWGILAPARTPQSIVRKLNADMATILGHAETAKRLAAEAAEAQIAPPEALDRLIAVEIAKWAKVAKIANIRAH